MGVATWYGAAEGGTTGTSEGGAVALLLACVNMNALRPQMASGAAPPQAHFTTECGFGSFLPDRLHI